MSVTGIIVGLVILAFVAVLLVMLWNRVITEMFDSLPKIPTGIF